MSKYLVIVESPAKTKKIKSFLSKDFDVIASVGHICDLPKKELGVNLKKKFETTYDWNSDKQDVINNIKKKSKNAEIVYLMTDGDREGESIATHITRLIPKNVQIKRAKTGSITKKDVLSAIENAGELNTHLFDAYEARRVADRLCGYKTSWLTRQATGGTSAGRVQSAALRILAEREKEIVGFIPKEYWPIDVKLKRKNGDIIFAKIKKPDQLEINTKEEAEKICDVLKKEIIKVSKFESKQVSVKPYAPFTTSTMYQSAASILGWGLEKTASTAQNLYEAGFISYHRTDSTFIVPEFVTAIGSTVLHEYGDNYLPSNPQIFTNKKMSQEAHEAIRITDLSNQNGPVGALSPLYKIIWKRTVASQMQNMSQQRSRVEFACDKYILSASGNKVLFDGWTKCWNYGSSSESELPILEVGEILELIDINTEQKFTQPPDRYNDRSIVKKLEDLGIGRPSTYKSIIKTLIDRKYITKGKNIKVTDVGIKVTDFLVKSGFCFVDLNFTANLEEKLDEITLNNIDKLVVLKEFWDRLKSDIVNGKTEMQKNSETDYPCKEKECDGKLVLRHSKFGSFYGCNNWKKGCKYIADVGENQEPVEKIKKEKIISEYECPLCKTLMVQRSGKYGIFYGCQNYPKCKGMRNSDGEVVKLKKKKNWKK